VTSVAADGWGPAFVAVTTKANGLPCLIVAAVAATWTARSAGGGCRVLAGTQRVQLVGAAGVGFEPTEPLGSTVFKTAPFDRSGTPPGGSVYAAADDATGGALSTFPVRGGAFDAATVEVPSPRPMPRCTDVSNGETQMASRSVSATRST
jgi:hypothetical protein